MIMKMMIKVRVNSNFTCLSGVPKSDVYLTSVQKIIHPIIYDTDDILP